MLPTTTRSGYRNPWVDIQREIDRVFDRMSPEAGNGWSAGGYPVDIHEDEDNLIVEAELPGFTKDQIDVTFEQGLLNITAERDAREPQGTQHLNERRYTRVSRSFRLPSSVDTDKVDASFQDGLLTLTLPKREEVKPRKIQVK